MAVLAAGGDWRKGKDCAEERGKVCNDMTRSDHNVDDNFFCELRHKLRKIYAWYSFGVLQHNLKSDMAASSTSVEAETSASVGAGAGGGAGVSAGVSDNTASGSSSGGRGGGDIDDEAAVVQAYTRRRIQSVKVSALCSHPPPFHVTNLQARQLTPASCSQVMLSADTGEAVHAALKTCGSILGNVVKHPTDDKYAWTAVAVSVILCATHLTAYTLQIPHTSTAKQSHRHAYFRSQWWRRDSHGCR